MHHPRPHDPKPSSPARRGWRSRLLRKAAATAAAGCLCLAPLTAAAANPKAAVAIARKAVAAYEAGEHNRSASLYHEAFKADPGTPGYLYSAARAEQIARQYRKAAATYERFLALPDVDPEMVEKARSYLKECRSAQADEVARDARAAAEGGDHGQAEALFIGAWKIAPARLDLLLAGAIAAQRAGHEEQAKAHLRAWLERAPADAPDRPQVEARLRGLGGDVPPPSTGTASGQTTPTVGASASAPAAPSNAAAWACLGGGAALLATGAALWWSQTADSTTLEEQLQNKAGGKVVGLSYTDYSAEVDRINQRRGLAIGAASVGVVAAAVGAWLYFDTPDSVSIAPDLGGRGLRVEVGF